MAQSHAIRIVVLIEEGGNFMMTKTTFIHHSLSTNGPNRPRNTNPDEINPSVARAGRTTHLTRTFLKKNDLLIDISYIFVVFFFFFW
jgi:hypothetical protein